MILTLQKKYSNVTSKLLFKVLLIVSFLNFYNVEKTNAQATYVLDQLAATPAYAILPVGKTNLFPLGTSIGDGVVNVTLPFTFQYNGGSYTAANVSMNGFMTFGPTAPATGEYFPISSAAGYLGAISAYGADLDLKTPTATINISTTTTGTSPNRIFKTEWIVQRSTGTAAYVPLDGTAGTNMQFQIWLYETTNVIEMHYQTFNPSSSAALQGQIGLRGATNAGYKNLNFSTPAQWPTLPTIMPIGSANNQTVYTRGSTGGVGQILTASNRTFRWTPAPCSAPTGVNVPAVSITSTSATLNWSAASPVPGLGYEYSINTTNTPAGAVAVPSGLTASLAGLTPAQQYYVFVRSVCSGSSTSSWSSFVTFTTLCNPVNVPYYQPFDNGVGVNAVSPYHTNLPTCTSQQNVGLGNNWVTSNQDSYYPDASMDANILMYNGTNPGNANPANVWFYTEGINLTAGTTYSLIYLYGGTATPSTVQNKMQVAFGSSPVATSMTTILDDHPDIKSSSFQNSINFVPPSTGVYYFGFRAYSNANNGKLYVDDIQVVVSNCLKPTAVSVSTIGPSSAVLSWTAPTPAPASGYAYYYSTSSTPPTNSATPNGFTATGITNVTLLGLNGSTNYYFWVRSNCGFGEFGEWTALNNAGSPFFTTLASLPYCASTSTTNQNYFTSFITSNAITNVNNPTGYSAGGYGDYTSQIITQAQSAVVNVATQYNDMAGGVGISMFVDWNQNGDFSDAGDTVYTSGAFLTVPPSVSFTVPGGATLGLTRMRIVVDWNFPTSPLPCGARPRSETEDYGFMVVTPPPPLTLSASTSTQCANTASPSITITAGLSDYDTFTWSPAGVSGTSGGGYNITSSTSQTFTLTAVQTTSPFRFNTVTYNYVAVQPPTPIIIATPSGANVCQNGTAIPLTATGGIVSGVQILTENFNAATNSWTVANNGGSAHAVWTLRPNGYNQPQFTTNSNDSSQFYNADSDTGVGGFSDASTVSNTFLTSPSFSTVGYTQASLSFWHFYDFFPTSHGYVQVSTNGTSWTTLADYTSDQGAPTGFVNPSIPLNAYLGQPTVYIRFWYEGFFDWNWAIDNVLVTGSGPTTFAWSPITGLWNDAAASSPYTGTPATTVYAFPNANTTYTATATTTVPIACPTNTTVNVTYTPIVAGTLSSDQVVSCINSLADITVSGYTGTVSSWQSANNPAFTGATTIAVTTPTLTTADMLPISGIKYFRAVITNGTCSIYSNAVTINIPAAVTWDGTAWDNVVGPDATTIAIFDDDYTSTGDLNACSVIVSTGVVTFLSGHNLIVQNTVNSSGGSLIFNDDASLVQPNNVANAVGVYNGGNIGNISYNRTTVPIRRYDFVYWSTPVYPQTLLALSPLTLSDKYFKFNQITNYWESVNSNSLMEPGKGYIIRGPQTYSISATAPFTGTFVGIPNNGDITTDIIYGLGTINLIGNPYPSAIDIDYFLTDAFNDTKIGGTIYLWTHTTQFNGSGSYLFSDYATYNLTGGVGTGVGTGVGASPVPNGKVAAGQSFMIEGSIPASTNQVVFKNSMRVVGNNGQFYKSGNTPTEFEALEKNRVWLEVFNADGLSKHALVGYIENATNNLDRLFDGKAVSAVNELSLYSLLENEKLAIQGRALPFDENDIVPLGFSSTTNGSYEIKLSNFDGFFENQDVYLEDLYLNIVHNLKNSNYSFVTETGTFENRFQLRYTSATLNTNQNIFNDNSVVIYKENNDIVVNSATTLLQSVQVFDIRGRELYNENNIKQNQFVISNLNSSEQVLIVKVSSVDGQVVNKKIIF